MSSLQGATTIFLVRHGQASARARDYDVLSSLGAEQARRLGTHLARAGVRLDALVTGPRLRQRDSARHLADAARAIGADWPEPRLIDAFDELPTREILLAGLHAYEVDARPIAAAMQRGDGFREHEYDALWAFMEQVITAWAADDLAGDGLEPFADFVARVDAALRAVATAHAGGTALVVSSAGPLGVALALAGADGYDHPRAVITRALRLTNTATLTLRFTAEGRPLLVDGPSHAHLPAELITTV